MSEFNEFDQQGSVPNRETGSIISHALKCIKGFWLWYRCHDHLSDWRVVIQVLQDLILLQWLKK
jgi:hypothetical protein